MRSDSDRIPGDLLAREAAHWRSTGSATATARDRERHPVVDGGVTSVRARIAVVDVSDDTAANNRAQDGAEDRASARTAPAHAPIVTTRRRTARIGYRDRLRTRRNRSRVVGSGRWSDRLRIDLRDGGRRFGLNDLRRRLRSCAMGSHAVGRSLLAGRRSRPFDGRDDLLARIRGAVGEGYPVRRGGKLQVLLEIIVDRCLLVAAASGQEDGASSCKQQITLPHENSSSQRVGE